MKGCKSQLGKIHVVPSPILETDRYIGPPIGRYTNFHRYFIDFLLCLSTAQFEPNSSCLIKVKTFEFYWNLFNKIFSCLANTFC